MKRLADLTGSPLNRLVNTEIHVGRDELSLQEVVGDVERELALVLGKGARGYRIGSGALFCSNRWDEVQDVGGVEPSHLKRLLDKPVVTEDLIERTIVHVRERLFDLLRTMREVGVSRKVLLHSLNAHKYHQKVTLLANCVKAFCPDDMPAIIPASTLSPEGIKEIIRSLPLDPTKLSDTAFEQMGLAPADYHTYPLQARLRYKLWSREAFFALLAEARIFEDDTAKGNKPKNTARIITFRDREGDWKIGTFINESSLHIHETGIQHPRKHRKKIVHSYFRVYQDLDTFLASQEHALAGLLRKGEQIGSFQDLMANFRSFSQEEQEELLWEMYEYFSHKTGFYDTTIREFLERFAGEPISMQLNILRILAGLDKDLTGKYGEIRYVVDALRRASMRRKRGAQFHQPTVSRK